MTGFKSITSLPRDGQVAWMAARQHGVTAHGRWTAAMLAGGPTAVLSHRSAAALWGLGRDGPVPTITVPGARRRGTAGIEVHSGRLRPDEVVIFDGIRVTSVGRALLDLAEILTVAQLVTVIDRATGARRIGRTTMPSVLRAAAGRRGLRTLKAALLLTRPQDVLTRSELERRALRLIERAKLPKPEVNVRLHGYEVDLLWRAAGLVVELDGREHHDTDTGLERDTRRTGDLMAQGWNVLRFTWRQVVNDPDWVIHVVRSRAA